MAMGLYRRVLCATDLSDGADVALRAADREARLHGAELYVLHALIGSTLGSPMSPQGVERSLIDRERLTSEVFEVLLARVAGVTGRTADEVNLAVEAGPPQAAIAACATEIGADLVVVGASGATGLRRWMGSVATHAVRALTASVLLARPTGRGAVVVVGTDLTSADLAARVGAQEAGLRAVPLVLAHSLEVVGAELALAEPGAVPPVAIPIVPVTELRATAERRLAEVLTTMGHPGETAVVEGPAGLALTRIADERGADLIVVGSSDRAGIDRLLLGSVAESVLAHAHCSVLVVRGPEG